MARCEFDTVTVTTETDGTATFYTRLVDGKIVAIKYAKTDYVNGVDFTITTDLTGEQLWREDSVDAAKTIYPRAATHSTLGAASLYDTVSSEPVEDYVRACYEKIKIVLANGGSEKVGTFTVIWER